MGSLFSNEGSLRNVAFPVPATQPSALAKKAKKIAKKAIKKEAKKAAGDAIKTMFNGPMVDLGGLELFPAVNRIDQNLAVVTASDGDVTTITGIFAGPAQFQAINEDGSLGPVQTAELSPEGQSELLEKSIERAASGKSALVDAFSRANEKRLSQPQHAKATVRQSTKAKTK